MRKVFVSVLGALLLVGLMAFSSVAVTAQPAAKGCTYSLACAGSANCGGPGKAAQCKIHCEDGPTIVCRMNI